MITKIFFIFIGITVLGFVYSFLRVQSLIRTSEEIVVKTTPYNKISEDTTKTMLVLGDSTAYGVGASISEESLPALISHFLGATSVENRAVSGAKVVDLTTQLSQVSRGEYDTILIQIGGNNVVARHDSREIAQSLEAFIKTLPPHRELIVLMCGDVGVATLLPWYLRGYYTEKTLEFHQAFGEMVPRVGGTYINLYLPKEKDPFYKEPEIYLAKDQFHPSSAGYQVWFETFQKQWKK